MRVRRKPEIAEAEFDAKWGAWIITHPDGDKQLMIEKEFAAHYEPVPEPPARQEDTLVCQCVCHVSPTATQHLDANNYPVPCYCAAPSVSEEQPARNTEQKRIAIHKGESLRGENHGR